MGLTGKGRTLVGAAEEEDMGGVEVGGVVAAVAVMAMIEGAEAGEDTTGTGAKAGIKLLLDFLLWSCVLPLRLCHQFS